MRFDITLRHATVLWMAVALGGASACSSAPAEPKTGIQVVAATYGGNCRASHGNSTKFVVAACQGKSACNYRVDVTNLDDPVPGCVKDFVVEWTCGESTTVNRAKSVGGSQGEAGYGSIVALTCEGAR